MALRDDGTRRSRRAQALPLAAVGGVALAVLLHAPLVGLVEHAGGTCRGPSTPHVAVGTSLPFSGRWFGVGGEAMNPMVSLSFDGRWWSPKSLHNLPLPDDATSITLVARDRLVVQTRSGPAQTYVPSGSEVVCPTTPGEDDFAGSLVWWVEGGVLLGALVLGWLVSERAERL
jgi:hypothetical protein